jgi:urease beta subunit
MRRDVPAWGLQPSWVTGESWYASVDNLKFLRNEEVGGWFGIADNRKVSVEPGTQVQVPTLEIPDPGLVVYRNALGWVKVVCQNFKPEVRDDLMDLPD